MMGRASAVTIIGRQRIRRLLVAPVLLAAAGIGHEATRPARAATPPAAPVTTTAATPEVPQVFFDQVDVELVELEVWVRAHGEPVRGLSREDFEVREDGRLVEVTHLAETDVLGPAAPPPAAPVGPGAGQAVPTVPAPGGLLVSFFVDRRSLPPHAGKRYAPAVQTLVERSLRPGDLGMVMAFDRDLETLAAPTADRRQLLLALDRALVPGSRAMVGAASRRRILNDVARAGTGANSFDAALRDSLVSDITVWAREREDDVRATLGGLVRHLATLAGAPGRRTVVYLGEGLRTRFAEPLVDAWEAKFAPPGTDAGIAAGRLPQKHDHALEQAIAEVAAVANACGVTINAVAGGHGLLGGGVDVESIDPGTSLGSADVFDQRDGLGRLAEPTGGTVAARLTEAGVVQLADELRPDYVLAYRASPEGGERRRIEVRVRPEATADRRVEVRHRSGRQPRDADTRMRDRVTTALQWNLGENPLGVTLVPGDGVREKDAVRLAVEIRIPLAAVTLLPAGEMLQGQLAIYLAARDDKGRSSPVLRTDFPLRARADQVAAAASAGQHVIWQTELTLRRAPHQLVVGVRDQVGGSESIATASWSPGGDERRRR